MIADEVCAVSVLGIVVLLLWFAVAAEGGGGSTSRDILCNFSSSSITGILER